MDIPEKIIKVVESMRGLDEDLRQDFYLALLESDEAPPELENERHIRSFVAGYYANLKKNEHKKEANRRRIMAENSDAIREVYYTDNQADDPSDILSADELVGSRYDQLSPLVRKTLEMHYIQGMTVEDIAGQEWVDPNVIYKRLQRGREILKGETQ